MIALETVLGYHLSGSVINIEQGKYMMMWDIKIIIIKNSRIPLFLDEISIKKWLKKLIIFLFVAS